MRSINYQAIKRLGKEMNPVLHNIIRDCVAKYLREKEETIYDVDGINTDKY